MGEVRRCADLSAACAELAVTFGLLATLHALDEDADLVPPEEEAKYLDALEAFVKRRRADGPVAA